MKNTVLIILFLFALISCKKEKTDHQSRCWTHRLFQNDFSYNRIAQADKNTIYCYGSKLDPYKSKLVYTLIKSEDLGQTWKKVNVNGSQLNGLKDISFFNSSNGIISGYRTLFKTNNGGQNWDTISIGYQDFTGLLIHDDKIFGYKGNNFTYSTDMGKNWIKPSVPRQVSSMCFINNQTGYASAITGFYETNDGGITWVKKEGLRYGFIKMDFIDSNNGIAVSISKKSQFGPIKEHLNITEDGGKSWKEISFDPSLEVRLTEDFPILYKSDNEIYIGTADGILISENKGKSWKYDYVDGTYRKSVFIDDIKAIGNKIIAVGYKGTILIKE